MHHYSIVTKFNLQLRCYIHDVVYSAKALVIPAARNPFLPVKYVSTDVLSQASLLQVVLACSCIDPLE